MPKVKVSKNSDVNWANDVFQFPRLIAEMEMAGAFTLELLHELRDSMDLSNEEIMQLVDRAQAKWDMIKSKTLRK